MTLFQPALPPLQSEWLHPDPIKAKTFQYRHRPLAGTRFVFGPGQPGPYFSGELLHPFECLGAREGVIPETLGLGHLGSRDASIISGPGKAL